MGNTKFRVTLRAIVPMVFLAASSSVSGAFIDLKVSATGGDTVLEIDKNPISCHNDKNCIETNRGQKLDLDFRLTQACQPNGPEYRLTGMQFSMIQSEPDGSGNPVKAFGKYVLPAIVTRDFDLDTQGKVLWKSSDYPNRRNQINDQLINLKNENEGVYVVFFKVEATHCTDSSNIIYLDPRVENTGK